MGSQTAALYAGGNASPNAQTEDWNGASWVEVNDLNTAREGGSPAGTTTAGLFGGGSIAPVTAVTEEWNVPSNVTKTISTD